MTNGCDSPLRVFVLEMLIPLSIEVEAVDEKEARWFQSQFGLSLSVRNGRIREYSTLPGKLLRVREKEAKHDDDRTGND